RYFHAVFVRREGVAGQRCQHSRGSHTGNYENASRSREHLSPHHGQLCMKASRSALITSGCVDSIPCGKPLYTFNVPCFSSLIPRSAESAIGTTWSSSPCSSNTGTSIILRSSVRSVSENALMQSYCAFWPPIIPWRHQLRIRPSEIFAPGRLKP